VTTPAPAPVVAVTYTETRHSIVSAPPCTTSAGTTFDPDDLQVRVYSDGAVMASTSGSIIALWPTTLRTSVTWLDGDRFTGGIQSGLPALATAPDWVRGIVDDLRTDAR